MKAKTILTLLLYISSTSALLRSAPVYKSSESRLLRCGEPARLISQTVKKSDYGQWVRVELKENPKLKGWVLKDILTKRKPSCLFSSLPLNKLNGAMSDSSLEIARQEELVIREQQDSLDSE
jgi:hypothetical protein